ncbi:hypothetical protein [Pseudodonghicola sp.]|uniref:hypothetical protein n=1 Tax=Pseudodonghicola sp. TaxID=1969463 RepID=UPI003A97F91A
MAENNYESFLDIVRGSEAVRDRWAALVERSVTEAAEHGVTLEADDILNLRSARVAALGAPLDEDEYRAEILALPALSDAARRRDIAEGDEAARAAAVADVNRGKFDVSPDRWTDNAAARLAKARDLGIAVPPVVTESALSRDQMLAAIAEMPPAQRVAQARRWGLI